MRKGVVGFVLMLLLTAVIAGCGGSGGDDLVGNLSLTASSTNAGGGVYTVSGTATYTHPTRDPLGTEIAFTFTMFNSAGDILDTFAVTDKVGSSGQVGRFVNIPQQTSPVFVIVSARTGDLVDSEQVVVPALAPLSASPNAVSFATTELANSTKTVAVTGGITPYQIPVSSNPAEISASISGGTLTITRLVSTAGSATISIFDAVGTQVDIVVTYASP